MMKEQYFGIKVVQYYETGILSGPHLSEFSIKYGSKIFKIEINQIGIRIIEISSGKEAFLEELLQIFNNLDKLMMLLEGKFVPINNISILDVDKKEIRSLDKSKFIDNRLYLFNSADFTRGNNSLFIGDLSVLSAELYIQWIKMLDELDILHTMVLYCLSDIGLPIDCKCANMIEAFNPLEELINLYVPNYIIPKVRPHESRLSKYLEQILTTYGKLIFYEELSISQEKFIKILVDSRNRIMHIKSRQKNAHLNGEESLLYIIKLSYLYRIVLLNLLGIDISLYENKIKASVKELNEYNGILKKFLIKINK